MAEGSATTARAPSVVAVVVTTDPGPWFDEVLQALAAQDYGNFSVLVLVSGGSADPTETVASHLPGAFVRRLPERAAFGACVDEALAMVEGASFFLLCHDDCAPAPDAVHLMVEESFRSNAGIVSPKVVRWDDTRLLVHVGQGADKTGAVVERVQDGEIDAGQHDAVRDVFVAPGGCTLVRGDLLRALGGYDPAILAMGEDLDLSWRAHVAGARVVVAPAATARHLELVAAGSRPPPASDAPSLQALQRRHELAAVLTCYTRPHLLRVLPQAFALALGEVVVATLAGDRRRARAVLHAWRWNLSNVGALRRRRAALAAVRVLGDRDVRSLQVRGSARLSTYVSRLTHQGIDVAHGAHWARASRPESTAPTRSGEEGTEPGVAAAPGAGAAAAQNGRGTDAGGTLAEELTGSFGLGFSEDENFDDLDDFGRRRRKRRAASSAGILSSRRSRFLVGLVAAAVLVVGSRGLIGAPTPLIGQFAPFPSWTTLWHQFVSSWQPAGTGSDLPASPAFGFLGLAGTVLFGQTGLLQQVVTLGCIPLGAWGMSRLVRPFGSARGRLTASIAYLALPLALDALASGRWDGLVAYATTPWVVLRLARSTGLDPFDAPGERSARRGSTSWRQSLAGQVLALGALEAVAISFAPAMVVVVLVAGLGVAGGSLVAGGARRGARALAAALGGTVCAAILCAPWVVGVLSAGRAALGTLGLATGAASSPGWGGLLRMAVGPVGSSPLAWLLLAAAVPVLLVARAARLAWAVRLWAIALPAWFLALDAAKGWTVPFAPSVDVLLAPAAVAVAGAIGLGVAAFEVDLAGYRFGWRQGVAVLSVAAIVVGLLPTVVEARGGRWGQPTTGYEAAAGFPVVHRGSPGYRVLWLGDPRALPSGGWAIGPGLAYATSTDGTSSLADLWAPASPGRAGHLADALVVAMHGETVLLGRALERARVRFVVVVTALAPHVPGASSAPTYPVPSGLLAALRRQEDLRTVPVGPGGLTVFENTAFVSTGVRGASVTSGRAGGAASLLDPLGTAGELLLWAVVAAALLARRRWLGWWPQFRHGVGRAWAGRRARGQPGARTSPGERAPPGEQDGAAAELVGVPASRAQRNAGPDLPAQVVEGDG